MTDQQALEHIDQRMTEARDAEGRLSAKQATIDHTRAALNEAGVLSGPLPERVRKLAADLRDVAADRDHLRAERTQVREMLDGAGIPADTIPAAVAMLLQERAEWRARTPPAPDVAPGGVGVEWGIGGYELSVNGENVGEIAYCGGDMWCAFRVGMEPVTRLRDDATARAVLLALAGQECGRVQFDLRPGATWETILMMRARGLGWVVDALLGADGVSSRTADPEIVRAWVAHGQAALTIEAVGS